MLPLIYQAITVVHHYHFCDRSPAKSSDFSWNRNHTLAQRGPCIITQCPWRTCPCDRFVIAQGCKHCVGWNNTGPGSNCVRGFRWRRLEGNHCFHHLWKPCCIWPLCAWLSQGVRKKGQAQLGADQAPAQRPAAKLTADAEHPSTTFRRLLLSYLSPHSDKDSWRMVLPVVGPT